jgi:hypothetical protein
MGRRDGEAKLKGGKIRYVPMLPELAGELRRFPGVIGEDRIFRPETGATSGRQRVEGSFNDQSRTFIFMICVTRLRPGS